MHKIIGLLVTAWLVLANSTFAGEAEADAEVYWILLHEAAVKRDLKLGNEQLAAYEKLLGDFDIRYIPLRNQSKKSLETGLSQITAECRKSLAALLTPVQIKRLDEIFLQRLGTSMLLRENVTQRLKCSTTQTQQIKAIVDETRKALAEIEKQAGQLKSGEKKSTDSKVSSGETRESLEKQFRDMKIDEQKKLLDLLQPTQRTAWKEMIGDAFDTSQLGQLAFKAPELVDSKEWINSPPLRLQDLSGKVVVVHFYACGCINCIHNYPWYRQWHEKYREQGVVMIGIHTPETAAESVLENVRSKAAAEKFTFPVLIDSLAANWNAWGNSMWPCVYLIDKRGYVRHTWPGELKWQGTDGEKIMRERIESLLKEKFELPVKK